MQSTFSWALLEICWGLKRTPNIDFWDSLEAGSCPHVHRVLTTYCSVCESWYQERNAGRVVHWELYDEDSAQAVVQKRKEHIPFFCD